MLVKIVMIYFTMMQKRKLSFWDILETSFGFVKIRYGFFQMNDNTLHFF